MFILHAVVRIYNTSNWLMQPHSADIHVCIYSKYNKKFQFTTPNTQGKRNISYDLVRTQKCLQLRKQTKLCTIIRYIKLTKTKSYRTFLYEHNRSCSIIDCIVFRFTPELRYMAVHCGYFLYTRTAVNDQLVCALLNGPTSALVSSPLFHLDIAVNGAQIWQQNSSALPLEHYLWNVSDNKAINRLRQRI